MTCGATPGIGSTRDASRLDLRACDVEPVIDRSCAIHGARGTSDILSVEFVAVIQHIEVDPAATRMRLDISVLDISKLAWLIDQEVTVTVAPAPPAKTKRKTDVGTSRPASDSEAVPVGGRTSRLSGASERTNE